MELPAPLRLAVEQALAHVPRADLTRAAGLLSQRYRAERRDGRFHLAGDLAALAYLATRLPATFAAISASMSAVSQIAGEFAPRTMLDVGAGPGSAMWAAAECWPSLDDALLIEASAPIRALGHRLAGDISVAKVEWQDRNLDQGLPDMPPRDLVTLAYVLDELEPPSRERLIDRLWALTGGLLLIIEPGTPAGWQRILDARTRLVALGAHLVAPCPHSAACPVISPDWCHFSRRVARSRLHRQVKEADVPWEDEKFIYVAASRSPVRPPAARVLTPPRSAPGRISLKLCTDKGHLEERLVSKRDKDAYRTARRAGWGDAI